MAKKKTGKARVAEKIAIIHKEEPTKPMKAVIGKAFGIARSEGYRLPKKKGKP